MKKALVEQDLGKIEETFVRMGGNKAVLGLKLLNEAKFHEAKLADLRKKIDDEGVTTEMCQGSYSITRENPALHSYNTMIKNFQSLIKQINELLGSENVNPSDALEEFLKK